MNCSCDVREHHIHCKRGYFIIYRHRGLKHDEFKLFRVTDPKNIPKDVETIKKLKTYRVGDMHEL